MGLVLINIVNKCNQSCSYCNVIPEFNIMNQSTSMSTDLFKKIIDKLSINDKIDIHLTGGELMLDSNILDKLNYCLKINNFISLSTNGLNHNALIPYSDSISINLSFHHEYINFENFKLKLKDFNYNVRVNIPISISYDYSSLLNFLVDHNIDYDLEPLYQYYNNIDILLSIKEKYYKYFKIYPFYYNMTLIDLLLSDIKNKSKFCINSIFEIYTNGLVEHICTNWINNIDNCDFKSKVIKCEKTKCPMSFLYKTNKRV